MIIPASKAIYTPNLIKYITRRTKNIDNGEVVVYADNKAILREIYKTVHKESDMIVKASTTATVIKDEIKKVFIDISIGYSNNKLRPRLTFQ